MRRTWFAAALCLLLVSSVAPAIARAQATPAGASRVTITEQHVTPDFPSGMTFTLAAHADVPVTRVELFYRVTNQATEHLATVPVASPSTSVQITYRLDLQTDFLPAGVQLITFWRFHDTAGNPVDSPRQTVQWYDNRFQWQTVTTADATVSYHGLSTAFAQNIATSAQQSIDTLTTLYGVTRVTPLQIWIYPDASDFAGSRQPNTREAVAGLSYPEYALITAVIPNGSASELGRIIPHEVSHQMLYQATRNPWNAPPVWLDEGLAEYAQIGGTDGFEQAVREAARSNGLLGFAGLSLSFPYDPGVAYLAYAEGYSAVTYVVATYGNEGVTRLVREMAKGESYDQAFSRALGRTMAQLEHDWRIWIGQRGHSDDDVPPHRDVARAAWVQCPGRHRW